MDKLLVSKVDNVQLRTHTSDLSGTLHLTPHHLFFSPDATSSTTAEIWISYPAINLMTRLPQTILGLYPIQIRTKTFHHYVFSFQQDRSAEEVWQSVKDCAVISESRSLHQ